MLCWKRRFNIYFKFIAIISLAIFYFGFLFRESLHALEISKGVGSIRNSNKAKNELNKQKIKNLSKQRQVMKKPNSEELRRQLANEQKRYDAEETKRFIVDDPETNNNYDIIDKINMKLTSTTLNPVYEYSEELHSAIEKELYERKQHLHNICTKEHLFGIYPPKSHEFFISPGHNLIWCNVFKAASSTWMYYFNILGGYDIKYLQHTKMSPLELARIRFPRPKFNELLDAFNGPSSLLSFLIVREPFERLLSGYRDKLENCHNKFYKVLSKQIIKTFRQNIPMKRHHNTGPTFKEFLLYLIKNVKFKRHLDEHWTPIYNFCTPCSINYTLIAKIETFQRDSEYIIRQAGLEPLLLNKMPNHKIKTITNHSTSKTSTLINKYFSKIDRNTLDELIKIYRLDFELFGYNYTKYYDIVEPLPPINLTTFTTTTNTTTTTTTTLVNLFNLTDTTNNNNF